ncbi:hypothetical protein CPC16_003643 [Podila verticillata]|nr:hypothetical protein BGZ52_005224 [Haplosporangium bisporale]KAF9215688.1 hypothetical protein BGZ59_000568 [Podila verticillata]KAF9392046.1 hypothetical protein CPC16_003643 [Podila verticillata]KAI9239083.1 MAG: hypothetical protein BYD32DRAFT_412109 [Podila humilis]KFH67636.1 hypothetical protein MVEG_06368 [Podila verticillata NRRL 6337]
MEKICYKAPNQPGQHMPDVFVMAEPGMAAKYRAQRSHQGPTGNHPHHLKETDLGDRPLALVDVVQSFDIYQTSTGKGFEGNVARPAKSDLASLFNTENPEAIVEQIVLQGEIQGSRV